MLLKSQMKTAEYWIKHLQLLPHPEGGYYKEVYRSNAETHHLPTGFDGSRNFCTSIYFLLTSSDRSVFHRIKSDETWHFYSGSTLTIYVLDKNGYKEIKVGNNPENGESLQVTIPANSWFGALVQPGGTFALTGCTVSPGFDFRDFEIAPRNLLLDLFPEYTDIIMKLT